ISTILNANPLGAVNGSGASATPGAPKYAVNLITDTETAKSRVADGKTAGLLIVTRDTSTHDLAFQYVTNDGSITDQVAAGVRQGAAAVAIQDRLTNLGITPAQQAALGKQPAYDVEPATPGKTPPKGVEAFINGQVGGFVLAIVIFMAIILYGQWIA